MFIAVSMASASAVPVAYRPAGTTPILSPPGSLKTNRSSAVRRYDRRSTTSGVPTIEGDSVLVVEYANRLGAAG